MWKQLLSEAHSQASQTKLRPKNLIVLGEEGCGKTELINRIQGRKPVDDRPQGTGLEYTFLDVKDEESDEIIERMGVYTLNGGAESASLLDLLLTNELVGDTLVMLVVDFSHPWNAIDTLDKWSATLNGLMSKIDPDVLEKLKKARVDAFQSYTEPAAEGAEKVEGDEEQEKVVIDMEPDMLKVNIGLPMVIVATKSDAQVKLEQDYGYRQEKLDFIQLHLRQFAMKHGASLVYSGKGGKNKEVLYQAIVNAAYGTPLKIKANPEDNQGVFIPAGWDNTEKINQLTLSFQDVSAGAAFGEHIEDPGLDTAAAGQGDEHHAENEQDFLAKQKQLLGKDKDGGRDDAPPEPAPPAAARQTKTAPETRAPSAAGSGTRSAEAASPRTTRSTASTARGSRAPGAPGPGKAGDKDVLTDFFNSLLKKDGAGKAGAGAGAKGGAAPSK
eukprot:m.25236 g.25236  ORF g.25236 m.25236 type:complete len:442 (-) comp4221_c0_seq1:29-1354(-)